MLRQVIMILNCSRIFSLPMTILSWLVIFTYSVLDSGNIFYGLLALIGLCLVHLGTNLLDDYFDYKSLIKRVDFDKTEYLKHSQKTKCRYLVNGLMRESKLLLIVAGYFGAALLVALFLFFKCGIGVLYFTLIGAVIALTYSFASRIYLSEILVGLAYGPALFGGVYYVMSGTYSEEVFLLSIPTMFMTIVLLYVHTVMDYEFDTNEGKKTIANSFDSRLDSLAVLKYFLLAAYISPIFLCIFDVLDWQIFLVYLTIPLAKDLYKSLWQYSCNPEGLPVSKWYHFPMENLRNFKEKDETAFMIRMLQARNLMIYFSIAFVLAIFLSEAL